MQNGIATPKVYQGPGKGMLGIPGCSHCYMKAGTAVLAGDRLPSKGLPWAQSLLLTLGRNTNGTHCQYLAT